MLTFYVILLLCVVAINAYIIQNLIKSRAKIQNELVCLNDSKISQNRHFNNIRQDIDSIMFQIRELRQETPIKRLEGAEKSINNLASDLDRTIGTIDQVQEKIAEINVTLENIINQLNESNK
jgi:predicted  nucleic acid-binding Zn-ribbon protein